MLRSGFVAQVAAVVTSLTIERVLNCWNDPSLNAGQVIVSIFKTLHHPFNINFSDPDQLQHGIFQAATKGWSDKTDE